MKKIVYIAVILGLTAINFGMSFVAAPEGTLPKSVTNVIQNKQNTINPVSQGISPLAIVNNPQAYLNKTVTFSGEFVSFSSLGLDYKPAFRDSSKYIGVLMRRPDVKKNTVPLSELKMFMNREMAEKNIDLEAGDTFCLTGKVFSTALGDPWLDITEFNVTNKKNKPEEKKPEEKKMEIKK